MRSLFHRAEDPHYVSAPPSAAETVTDTAASHETAGKAEHAVVSREHTARQARARKIVTPQERLVRKRRVAAATLALSLLVGGRWIVANQEPTYPKGEGVYATNTAPQWGQMKQPNAATFYMAATDALNYETVFGNSGGYRGGSSRLLMDEPASVQKPYVERAQPSLNLLRQGMQYPYVADFQTNHFKTNPSEAKGLSRPVVNFIAQREMARLLAAEANVRASEGNHAGAIESSLDAIRLGVDQSQGHSLVDGMIGVLIQGIGAKEGIKHVANLSPQEARAAATRLQTTLANESWFARILTAERDVMYEVLQSLYSGAEQGGLSTLGIGNPEQALSGIGTRLVYGAGLLYFTKQGLVDDVATYNDRVLARVKLPYYQARQLPPVAESSNPLVRIASPGYERAFRQATVKAAWNRVLLAQLAVQAYRGDHGGTLPASLAVLTQGTAPYLTALPTDPFSPTAADPLRYDPRSGNVYSVGDNGTDDGNAGDDNAELRDE